MNNKLTVGEDIIFPFNNTVETRKENRLQAFDYSSPGYYFATICVEDRIAHFGNIKNAEMFLSPHGEVAAKFWREIPIHYPYAKLDEFIVMPNHIHGIVIIEPRRADDIRPYADLSKIIGYYKQTVSKTLRQNGRPNFS